MSGGSMSGRGFFFSEHRDTYRSGEQGALPGPWCRQAHAQRLVLMIESFENFLDSANPS
jgi:hypothetical protein